MDYAYLVDQLVEITLSADREYIRQSNRLEFMKQVRDKIQGKLEPRMVTDGFVNEVVSSMDIVLSDELEPEEVTRLADAFATCVAAQIGVMCLDNDFTISAVKGLSLNLQ